MAVPSNTVSVRRDNIVAGVPFSIDMLVLEASQVVIEYGDGERAVRDTDFTVSNVNEFGFTVTATPVFLGKIGATNTVFVNRETADTSDFTENDSFIRRRIATEFDRNTMRDQETGDKVSRAILAPIGETGPRIPAKADRAGTFLQWSADGSDVIVGELAGDAGLALLDARLTDHEIANIASFEGVYQWQATHQASNIGAFNAVNASFTATNNAVTATNNALNAFKNTKGQASGLASLGSDGILIPSQRPPTAAGFGFNVRSYGAIGDGVADDTVAVQAAVTAAKVKGGVVYVPAGVYKVTSTIDAMTNVTTQDGAGVSFLGDGPRASRIVWGGNNANPGLPVIDWGSNGTAEDYGVRGHVFFRGLTVQNTLGAALARVNLRVRRFAFFSISDCWFWGGSTNVLLESCLSCSFYSCMFNRSNYNVVARKGDLPNAFSGPNAIQFFGCIGGDAALACYYFIEPGQVQWYGGSIEGNNGIGIYGERTLAAGTQGAPPNAFVVRDVYFEANGGAADIYLVASGQSDICRLLVQNCSFHRLGAPRVFTTNNIFFQVNAGGADLIVEGCGFRHYGGYVPDASRKYIYFDGSVVAANKRDFLAKNAYAASAAVERSNLVTMRSGATAAVSGRTNPNHTGGIQDGTKAIGWSLQAQGSGVYRVYLDKPMIRPVVICSLVGQAGNAALNAEDTANGDWFDVKVFNINGLGAAGGFAFAAFPADPSL